MKSIITDDATKSINKNKDKLFIFDIDARQVKGKVNKKHWLYKWWKNEKHNK